MRPKSVDFPVPFRHAAVLLAGVAVGLLIQHTHKQSRTSPPCAPLGHTPQLIADTLKLAEEQRHARRKNRKKA